MGADRLYSSWFGTDAHCGAGRAAPYRYRSTAIYCRAETSIAINPRSRLDPGARVPVDGLAVRTPRQNETRPPGERRYGLVSKLCSWLTLMVTGNAKVAAAPDGTERTDNGRTKAP